MYGGKCNISVISSKVISSTEKDAEGNNGVTLIRAYELALDKLKVHGGLTSTRTDNAGNIPAL